MTTATADASTSASPAPSGSDPMDRPTPEGREPVTSARSGFIVHRTASLAYPYFEEGLAFSRELVAMLNKAQEGYCSTTLYREVFGEACRLHWLVMLRTPHDYKRLLDLVDNSAKWREWAAMDRLPDKGHGAWDKIFVEGGIAEHVYCPQHGVGVDDEHGNGHHGEDDFFQPPASHQSHVPVDHLLHTGNDGALVHRTMRVGYQVREEARFYLFRGAQRITEGLPGIASAYSYEEMWSVQDRLHALLQPLSPDDYGRLVEFERSDPQMQEIKNVQYAPGTAGEGLWPFMVTPGSLRDTLLIPDAR